MSAEEVQALSNKPATTFSLDDELKVGETLNRLSSPCVFVTLSLNLALPCHNLQRLHEKTPLADDLGKRVPRPAGQR